MSSHETRSTRQRIAPGVYVTSSRDSSASSDAESRPGAEPAAERNTAPWSASECLTPHEQFSLRVLEEIGSALVRAEQPRTGEVTAKQIEAAIEKYFTNPMFLSRLVSTCGYSPDNVQFLVNTEAMWERFIDHLHDEKKGKRGNTLQRVPAVFDRVTDEEFASWFKSTYAAKSPSYGVDPEVANDMIELAKVASESARTLRTGKIRAFLRELAETGVPRLCVESDKGLETAQEVYMILFALALRSARAIIPPERLVQLGAESSISPDPEPNDIVKLRMQLATDEFGERIVLARILETELRAQVARDEAAKREEAVRQQVRREADTQKRKLEEFHSRFQTFEVRDDSKVAIVLDGLESGNNIAQADKAKARCVAKIFRDIHQHLLDMRGDRGDLQGDPKMKELANVLLNPVTIGLVAKAAGFDLPKAMGVHLPAKSPLPDQVMHISGLVESSPAVRRIFETILLGQPDGVLVLGALLVPFKDVRNYASELVWRSPSATCRDVQKFKHFTELVRWALTHQRTQGRSAVNDRSQGAASTQEKAQEVEIPEWLSDLCRDSAVACWGKDKKVCFRLTANPDIEFELPIKKLKEATTPECRSAFTAEYRKLLAAALARCEVETIVSELTGRCGFTLVTSQGEEGGMIIQHPAYGLEVRLPPERERWGKSLNHLEEAFSECEMVWQALFDDAITSGFEVSREADGTSVLKGGNELLRLSDSRFVSLGKMDEVAQLIDTDQEERLKEEQKLQRATQRMESSRARGEELILPKRGDEVLILDASVFIWLGASRTQGGTWLDLLTTLSKLHNIKIWVPTVVADFEVAGEIFPFDDEKATTVDSRGTVLHQGVRDFFKTACRIRFPDGGLGDPAYKNPHSSTPRICIVETEADRRVYAQVKSFVPEAAPNKSGEIRKRLHEQVYHHGAGDRSIQGLLSRAPSGVHVTVVSDDVKFSSSLDRCVAGNPISTCTTGVLLRDMFAERWRLPAFDWGSTTLYGVIKEIKGGAYNPSGETQYLPRYEHVGYRPTTSSAPVFSMRSIIRKGC